MDSEDLVLYETNNIRKSFFDRRDYHYIKLKNNFSAFLVYDPPTETDKMLDENKKDE